MRVHLGLTPGGEGREGENVGFVIQSMAPCGRALLTGTKQQDGQLDCERH